MKRSEVVIPLEEVALEGTLSLPDSARGLVLFAHGSGSSRHSPRNQFVADALCSAGLGTLLFDLLTSREDEAQRETRRLSFDIPFLAGRLMAVTKWARSEPFRRDLPLGYFGASTGAAAALVAAAQLGPAITSVVSRGGRPDLAEAFLDRVLAPTLLIVGQADTMVVGLNRQAYQRLQCEKELRLVPGATHLFEEPGALDIVANLAADWFARHPQKPREKSQRLS